MTDIAKSCGKDRDAAMEQAEAFRRFLFCDVRVNSADDKADAALLQCTKLICNLFICFVGQDEHGDQIAAD